MDLRKWIRISIFNLLIVAVLGVLLRYKIAFSFPFIDQKRLLHGHSHFAFGGWVTQALMALVVSRLSAIGGRDRFKRYNPLLWANLVCAYGMVVSFLLQGYGFFSITFSTLSIVVSYFFGLYVWRDIKRSDRNSILFPWLKAATFFNALSSLGAFALAFMMATHNLHQKWYLAAVYFFLHFQYNGWFSFVILGLLSEKLREAGASHRSLIGIFRLFAVSCVPAYFLSALWLPIPGGVYAIVVAAALLQVAGWGWILRLVHARRGLIKENLSTIPYLILLLSLVAFSVKFFLQAGSVIPALSTFAFGFRPIVIGYLHLVLLGVTSLFILGYAMHKRAVEVNAASKAGLAIFISGIVLNELMLMIQGVAAMGYVSIPYANEALFIIAFMLFAGLAVLNFAYSKLNFRFDGRTTTTVGSLNT